MFLWVKVRLPSPVARVGDRATGRDVTLIIEDVTQAVVESDEWRADSVSRTVSVLSTIRSGDPAAAAEVVSYERKPTLSAASNSNS